MAIIKNVELWYAKLDPKNPADKNTDKPYWGLQIRTSDIKAVKEWKELGLRVKPLKQKVKDDDGNFMEDELGDPIYEEVKDAKGKQVYSANLRKRVKKADGSDMAPVQLVLGDLTPLDPKTLGNGSIGNVRIFQYDYTYEGKDGVANMLMAVQVTTYREYVPRNSGEDFEMVDTEVVKIADNQDIESEVKDKEQDEFDDEIAF